MLIEQLIFCLRTPQPVPFYQEPENPDSEEPSPTYRQQFIHLWDAKEESNTAWPVNHSPMSMELKSLLRPCFCKEEEAKHLHPNEIHCEFLLLFLDMVQWWDQHTRPMHPHGLDATEGLVKGVQMSDVKARFCGLLHICFLIWDSGLLDNNTAKRLDDRLRAEERYSLTEARTNGGLLRALLFSRNDLKTNAKHSAHWCMHWNLQFREFTDEEQSSLRQLNNVTLRRSRTCTPWSV